MVNWTSEGSSQVFVFDKEKKNIRKNSIEDVASRKYFYDIDFSQILNPESLKYINEETMHNFNESQPIERTLSNIEGEYAACLERIKEFFSDLTPWLRDNCYVITKEEKGMLAVYIALQYIRTAKSRRLYQQMADLTDQMLTEVNASTEMHTKYGIISEEEAKLIHSSSLIDREHIISFSTTISRKIWVFAKNSTAHPLFTSDNPVWTHNEYGGSNGLRSKGVEIVFVLTPQISLHMYDGYFFSAHCALDRRCIEINDIKKIETINCLTALNSDRCIFSNSDDFSEINAMLNSDPKCFETPSVQMLWNGKTYFPRSK